MGRFSGKVALIVGCGSGEGIGSTTAKLLAREGARLVVADHKIDNARALESQIRAEGGDVIGCQADGAREDDARTMVDLAVKSYGGLDCLHYNPLASGPKGIMTDSAEDVLTIGLDVFDHAFAVVTRGFLLSLRAAVPEMLKRGGGSIVYTSSTNGLVADSVRGAYSAAKSAGNMLVQHVAVAYGKRGIRANAVAPGLTLTHSWKSESDPFSQAHLRHTLTPRLGRSEDQAKMIAFLLSDDAGYITGQVITVDGGANVHGPTYAEVNDGSFVPAPSWRPPAT